MRAIAQAVLVTASFVFGIGQPSAATFTVVTGALVGGFTPPTGCNFKLDGDIQPGDLAKLASARAQVEQLIARRLGNDASMAEQWKANSPVLCLNSRGGNFAEGLRIAKFLMNDVDGTVTTYVMNRAECYSACGLIFLAGQIHDRGGEDYPSRYLHVGGRLGFHAPYLVEPAEPDDQKKYSRRDMANVFKLAIRSVTDAIELFDRRTRGGPGLNDDNRPWVNASLFIEMLRKGPDELFAIDTVGKSGRWGINLVGVKEVGVLNTKALQRACDNVYSREGDSEAMSEEEQLYFKPLPPSDPVFNRLKRVKGVSLFEFQVVRSYNYCAVQAASSPTPKVENLIIKLYRGQSPDNLDLSNGGYEVPLWAAAFLPSTPLRNLLGK